MILTTIAFLCFIGQVLAWLLLPLSGGSSATETESELGIEEVAAA